MTNVDVKHDIIHFLLNRGVFARQVNDVQYVTRCPFCGDSQRNQNSGHFYLRIDTKSNSNVVYYCHKCPHHGVLTYEVLERLGIDDINLKQGISQLNKTSDRYDSKHLGSEQGEKSYDYIVPQVSDGPKTEYINRRLGFNLDAEEFTRLRVITSFREFLLSNKISDISCSQFVARNLEENYVGFLTSKKSHILFRDITEKQKFRWIKYKINKSDEDTEKIFYALESAFNVLTTEPININLTEGVMDILSVAYNMGYGNPEENINISISGKYYLSILNYLASLGFIGSNITVNIFSDNDEKYDTSIEYYRNRLKKFRYIFGDFNVYYNLRQKDFGVPIGDIYSKKYKL